MKRRLVPVTGWEAQSDGRAAQGVDVRVLPLIRGIAETGTLMGAARACGVPYRTAWGVVEEARRTLGTPLVTLARGRGASLTPMARHWLEVDDQARNALATKTLAIEIPTSATRVASKPRAMVRVAASHDIALAQLKDRWRVGHGIAVEFRGSAESLDAYRAGQVELAGFHIAMESDGPADPLLARLDPSRDALLRFMTREQGLIVARGNPRRVRALEDLAMKHLVIINRQPASGTRLLFDRLLARAGCERSELNGYSNEEFTHAAVAATIAAGRADVGFGIRAAAAQFKLAFLPLVTERYLFACRRRALESARVEAFRALLASPATRAVVTPLPGYALDRPGDVASAAFAGARYVATDTRP